MSEKQKKMARRIVEFLDEMGYLIKTKNKERRGIFEVSLVA